MSEATNCPKPFKLPKSVEFADFLYDCKRFIGKLFRPSSSRRRNQQQRCPERRPKEPKDSFMGVVLQVDMSKPGWHRGIYDITKNCGEYETVNVNEDGLVYVSGIGDGEEVLRKLGNSRRFRAVKVEYGQCSNKMFIRPTPKPTQSHGGHYPRSSNRVHPMGYGYINQYGGYPNQQPRGYLGLGYGYQQPGYYLGDGYPQQSSCPFQPMSNYGY